LDLAFKEVMTVFTPFPIICALMREGLTSFSENFRENNFKQAPNTFFRIPTSSPFLIMLTAFFIRDITIETDRALRNNTYIIQEANVKLGLNIIISIIVETG
jgi:hypothetical protein